MRPAQFERVTDAVNPVVSISEARLHLRVEHGEEDSYIMQAVAAATRYIESQWGLALITQTWKAVLDAWPSGGVKLRPYKASALTAVKVWDGSALTAETLSNYQIIAGRPSWVVLADGGTTPAPLRTRAGIEVHFTCGFADDETTIPADIKQAVLLLLGHWYENREASVSATTGFGVSAALSRGVEDLLAAYRSPRLA